MGASNSGRPRSSTVSLPDGRRVGLAEHGAADGLPVFFFHGFAGSRLQCPEAPGVAGAAATLGIRLIAVDRPAVGLSDRKRGRRPVDWADDMRALADALGLERFAIVAWSAGAPHALACGFALPERVLALGLANPAGRWFIGPGASRQISAESRALTTLARITPWTLRLALAQLRRRLLRSPQRTIEDRIRRLPRRDQETLADPVLRRLLIETAGEGFRQGIWGVYDDTLAVAYPWGFEPSAVRTPTWIWQGDADTTVLPALAQELAVTLPECVFSLLPDEGHFLVFTHWREILQTLAEAMEAKR
jgi:pimeloyl-ACP methyl ester carboxylesterase